MTSRIQRTSTSPCPSPCPLLLLLLLLLSACGPTPAPDAGLPDDTGADAPDDAPPPLRADAGPNLSAYVDEDVVLDGSASTGAVSFAWALGDGRRLPASPEPRATVRYPAPGRYSAVLTVEGADGTRRTDVAVVSITNRPVFTPRASGSIAIADGTPPTLAVAVEDDDALATYPLDANGVPGAPSKTTTRWRRIRSMRTECPARSPACRCATDRAKWPPSARASW